MAQEQFSEDFSSRDAIHQRLETVRAELGALSPGANTETRELLLALELARSQHLEAVDYLAQMEVRQEEALVALADWNGLELSPPYSILFTVGLRRQQQSLQRQSLSAVTMLHIHGRAIDEASERLAVQQRLRRKSSESVAVTRAHPASAVAEFHADLRSKALLESIARLQARRASQVAEGAAIAAALELSGHEIAATRGHVHFSRAELEEILARIGNERSTLLASTRSVSFEEGLATRQVTWKLEFLELEKDFWNRLFDAFSGDTRQVRGTAVAAIGRLKEKIDDWAEALRLQSPEHAVGDGEPAQEKVLREDLQRVLRLQEFVGFAIEELTDEGIRGTQILDRIIAGLLAIWDTELYVAEETASIGGKKVITYRAVTLGKILRLTAILFIGWFLLRYLSRGVHFLVEKRRNAAPEAADSARKWTFGLGLALLVVFALQRVHIPFTAFAFLGGTLAIGIGFGAQTLLKNFISGIIISLERPFRVGEMVEVDGITGFIRRIGIRASVIQHLNGVDTLVPNSILLENRLSNWTYGDEAMRHTVTVGVAYGSSTREVTRALLSVAQEHGLVLDQPKPAVYFKDFGDNALVFQLLFWFDATNTQPEPLASDIRFMIDHTFAERGIVVAFPQRDIHFDESQPLRIELSQPASQDDNEKPLP